VNITITDTSIAVEASKEEWTEFIPRLVAEYRSGYFVFAEFSEWCRSQQKRDAEIGRSKKKPGLNFYDKRTDKNWER
jgi:hypothetical protein